MATAIKMTEETGTDIVVAVAQNPGLVLLDTEKFDAWYDKLKAKAPEAGDMSVRKDREVLRSYAAEVRSEKAGIDKARLRLTKEWRDMVSQANDAGKVIEQRLEGLAAEVRAPLTEWEEAEKARVDSCRADIEAFKRAGNVSLDDTAASVRDRGADLWQQPIDPARFGDMVIEAQAAKDVSVASLKAALIRLEREEADRAELEKLRAETAEREAREVEAREKAEREAAEAAEIERQKARIEAERKAEEDRIANAAKEAEDRTRREAEEAAAAIEAKRSYARQIIEHIKQVGLGMIGGKTYPYGILIRELEEKIEINDDLGDMQGEVVAIRDATLVNVKAAMERQAERHAAQEREAEQRRTAEADELRAADKAHRAKIMKAAKEAIMTCGIDEEAAKKIVLLIRAGEVPNVSLAF
jgi:colicin import membrane protein